jgi:hypothetical protein
MDKAFRTEIVKIQEQARSHAKSQLLHGSMLTEILKMLKQSTLTNDDDIANRPEVANPPKVSEAGGSQGVAGHG